MGVEDAVAEDAAPEAVDVATLIEAFIDRVCMWMTAEKEIDEYKKMKGFKGSKRGS